jgi:hypothetical protein
MSQDDDFTKYQLLVAEKKIYDYKIDNAKENKKQIAYIDVPFSKNFATGQQRSENDFYQPPDTYGDLNEIAKDKDLAFKTIESYRESLSNDLSITNAQRIINEIRANQDLSYGVAKNLSTIYFVGSDGIVKTEDINLGISDNNMQVINSLDKNVSELLIHREGKYFSEIPGYNVDGVEVSYYIYADIGNENADPNIVQKLDDEKKLIKVDVNV